MATAANDTAIRVLMGTFIVGLTLNLATTSIGDRSPPVGWPETSPPGSIPGRLNGIHLRRIGKSAGRYEIAERPGFV
ncbi:hypothetical protein ACFV9G_19685, partial [Nocardioides sp. NPDC059952]|uniref:hypothetical protein n=1 Tax=Nocardioides sp. NPDC059952 TaxID=3347014 RepID=UPI00364BBC50